MSDEDKQTADAVKDAGKRQPVAIDLAKSDVKDVSPMPADPAPASTAQAKTHAPGPKLDPVKSYVESRLERADEAPATPPAPVKTSRSGGIFGGALSGGVLGLAAAFGYATLNPPPPQVADPRVAALETTLAGVDKRVNATAPDIERLAGALKAAEGRIAALDAKPPVVPKAVEDRLAGLDTALAGAREQAGDALRKIEGIEKLSSATQPVSDAPRPEAPRIDLAPIAARIVKVEEALASAERKAANDSNTTAALDTRLKTAEQAVSALSKPRPADTAAAILAVTGLARRALDGGETLGPQVTALAALGVAADTVKPLTVFSGQPAPRLTTLAADFATLSAKVPKPAAAEPAKDAKDLSVTERLKANFAGLVEVRPAGAPRQPDSAGLMAQAGTRLQSGDLAGFATAVSGLTDEQRAALKPVLDAIAARTAAVQALARIEAAALAAATRRN